MPTISDSFFNNKWSYTEIGEKKKAICVKTDGSLDFGKASKLVRVAEALKTAIGKTDFSPKNDSEIENFNSNLRVINARIKEFNKRHWDHIDEIAEIIKPPKKRAFPATAMSEKEYKKKAAEFSPKNSPVEGKKKVMSESTSPKTDAVTAKKNELLATVRSGAAPSSTKLAACKKIASDCSNAIFTAKEIHDIINFLASVSEGKVLIPQFAAILDRCEFDRAINWSRLFQKIAQHQGDKFQFPGAFIMHATYDSLANDRAKKNETAFNAFHFLGKHGEALNDDQRAKLINQVLKEMDSKPNSFKISTRVISQHLGTTEEMHPIDALFVLADKGEYFTRHPNDRKLFLDLLSGVLKDGRTPVPDNINKAVKFFINHKMLKELLPQQAVPIYVKLLDKYEGLKQPTAMQILAEKFESADLKEIKKRLVGLLISRTEVLEGLLKDKHFNEAADPEIQAQLKKVHEKAAPKQPQKPSE